MGRSVAANGVGTPFELSFWESVAGSNDPRQLEAYLAQYPTGTFSGLARAKIAALSPSVPAPAPLASPPATPTPVLAVAPSALISPPAATPVAMAAASAPLPQPVPLSAPAPVPAAVAAPASPPSLLDQLTALGKGSPVSKTALFTSTGPVPPRPELAPLTPVAIPDHFCSAIERNNFHDSAYVPAVAQADRNNEATIAHLKNVQALHAQALAANDIAGANALAHEATEFKPIADQAYVARTAMTELFSRIMAAPVKGC